MAAGGVSERMSAALQAGRFEALAGMLDEAELASPSAAVLDDESWPAALHLLAHVYNGGMPDARLLWKRLPQARKDSDAELQAAWRVLQVAWQGAGENVWVALAAYPWSPMLTPLVEALSERLRRQQLDLVARAYSAITPQRLAALCGVGQDDAGALAAARGWTADPGGSGALLVTPPPHVRGDVDPMVSLQQLSEYMLQLEA